MEGLSQICLRIRELREEAGLTEEQVAAHVGVTPAEYHEYEFRSDSVRDTVNPHRTESQSFFPVLPMLQTATNGRSSSARMAL